MVQPTAPQLATLGIPQYSESEDEPEDEGPTAIVEEYDKVQEQGVANPREGHRGRTSKPSMDWMAQATNLFEVHKLDYYMSVANEGAQSIHRATAMQPSGRTIQPMEGSVDHTQELQ